MFESILPAPKDAILGLIELFREDPNPQKINLTVGVYQSAEGVTPVLDVVRKAEKALAENAEGKSYLPIDGSPGYQACVQELLFGKEHEIVSTRRAATAQTPGGTGGLRVVADFLKQNLPKTTVWLSDPTWPNHPNIFAAAGVPTKVYPYFDAATGALDFAAMIETLQKIPSGDTVLFHACCHNPTGADPTLEQWQQIASVLQERNLLPFIDFAYQGFAGGIEQDAASVRLFCKPDNELIICNSFSKTFGLYRERVGALTVVTKNKETASTVASQIKRTIRANYSNPPAHGGSIVKMVLGDKTLRTEWEQEVDAMRSRIHSARKLLVDKLKEHGVKRDFSFLQNQNGMFSYTGLTPEQVETLQKEHSIYIVRSGRINVAGVNEQNVDRLSLAIKSVL